MIGLYAAVANANHMATWGGADLLLGTNPLAIGVPSGAGPLVLDIATSIVAYGTVKKYAQRGLHHAGRLVRQCRDRRADHRRRTARDDGMLLPMGEYKGAGLALMLGLIAGVLNGAAFGRDVVDFNADDKSETNTGHFIIAVDIARFMPLATFNAEVDRHMRDLRASKRLPGVDDDPAARRPPRRMPRRTLNATAFRCRSSSWRSSTSSRANLPSSRWRSARLGSALGWGSRKLAYRLRSRPREQRDPDSIAGPRQNELQLDSVGVADQFAPKRNGARLSDQVQRIEPRPAEVNEGRNSWCRQTKFVPPPHVCCSRNFCRRRGSVRPVQRRSSRRR